MLSFAKISLIWKMILYLSPSIIWTTGNVCMNINLHLVVLIPFNCHYAYALSHDYIMNWSDLNRYLVPGSSSKLFCNMINLTWKIIIWNPTSLSFFYLFIEVEYGVCSALYLSPQTCGYIISSWYSILIT